MPLPKIKTDSVVEHSPEMSAEKGDEKSGPTLPERARTSSDLGLIPDRMKRAALVALESCLKATKRFWDKESKDWVIEQDHATVIRAAELTLAYAEGRPVERKFELRGNVETFEDRKQQLLLSPEGVRFLLAARAISDREAAEALAKLAVSSQE